MTMLLTALVIGMAVGGAIGLLVGRRTAFGAMVGVLLGGAVAVAGVMAWPGASSPGESLAPAQFEQAVLRCPRPVLVDFYATWCGPCKVLAPTIESLRQRYQGRVDVVTIDIDQAPRLAADYQVQAVPTVLIFQNGQPVRRLTGVRPEQEYQQVLDLLLAGTPSTQQGAEP